MVDAKISVRDVVLMSRVRLARNFADLPFPLRMRPEDGERAQFRVADALRHAPEGQEYRLFRMFDLPDAERRALAEKNLVSPDLLSAGENAAVLLRRDERVCVMLNENDHVRIHAMLPDLSLDAAAALAFEVDDAIGKRVQYAFDAEFGFLTSCLTNAGTGLRASALLHLPSLTRSGGMGRAAEDLTKLGLSLRPMRGDGGEAMGELYLIGNQVALGFAEQELIDSLEAVIGKIVDRERAARELLLLEDDGQLADRLLRSLGILRHAWLLEEAEWMRRWSDVRLAVQAGLFSMDLSKWDALLSAARPAHLEKGVQRELSSVERDAQRALLIREALRDVRA